MSIAKPTALGAAVAVFALGATLSRPQPGAAVGWSPEQPRQGTLIRIVVQPDTVRASEQSQALVEGTLAGQALHFEAAPSGFHTLAAVPLGAQETIPLVLTIRYGKGEPEHRFIRIPVGQTEYPVEQLRVASRFVEQPDSALRARIAAERAATRAVYRRSQDTPRLWTGDFVRPAAGPITSAFGTARVFNGQVQSRHWGVDLDGERGDPVVAANRGVVALVEDLYYSGNVVYLDHGRGLVTAYLHLSEALVAQGDTVEGGRLIGRIGATGRVTGPHLHWLTRQGRVTVDPMSVLQLDLSAFGAPPPPDSVAAP